MRRRRGLGLWDSGQDMAPVFLYDGSSDSLRGGGELARSRGEAPVDPRAEDKASSRPSEEEPHSKTTFIHGPVLPAGHQASPRALA